MLELSRENVFKKMHLFGVLPPNIDGLMQDVTPSLGHWSYVFLALIGMLSWCDRDSGVNIEICVFVIQGSSFLLQFPQVSVESTFREGAAEFNIFAERVWGIAADLEPRRQNRIYVQLRSIPRLWNALDLQGWWWENDLYCGQSKIKWSWGNE